MGLGLLLDLGYLESAWKMGSVPASPVSPGASLGLVQLLPTADCLLHVIVERFFPNDQEDSGSSEEHKFFTVPVSAGP